MANEDRTTKRGASVRCERTNPDAKNFGLKSRDIGYAGLNALKEEYKSFESISTIHDRWNVFCSWVKAEQGIKDLRKVEVSHLMQYADHLRDRFENDEIKASTAQNYLSAVNRVMEIARGDNKVRVDPVKQGDLPRRSGISEGDKSISQERHDKVTYIATERTGALLNLQRELGLRFEESAKLNADKALAQAQSKGCVEIRDGTKGGRPRFVPIFEQSQIKALEHARDIQNGRSMIPAEQSYKEFRQDAYKEAARLGVKFHGERHAYAQNRYEKLSGVKCPVKAGIKHGNAHHKYISREKGISVETAKSLDREVRMQIARELGHGRVDVTNSYLG